MGWGMKKTSKISTNFPIVFTRRVRKMATKFLVIEAPGFSLKLPGSQAIKLDDLSSALPENDDTALFFAPPSLREDASLQAILDSGASVSCLFLDESQAEDFAALPFFSGPRSTGVKNSLAKGSTIYSETFFQAGKVGERLDPCFRFARGKLNPKRSVDVWGTLHSLLFLGISTLPEQGEKGSGERVDVQIGADESFLAFTVRFDLPEADLAAFRTHPLLQLPRTAVDFFEVRYLQDAKKVELLALVFLKRAGKGAVEAQSLHPSAALEKDQADYNFQTFGSLSGKNVEEKRVFSGGFKKKFSETIKVAGAKPVAEKPITVTAEKIVDAENGNFLVSGEVLQTNDKVVVSGSAGLGKKSADAEAKGPSASAQPKEKSGSLLESKIEGLQATLQQREELIKKLNQEIADIKDPTKMGVISGIKDNQVEGLKDNISRLNTELEDAHGREKDMIAVLDKAVQMKDEAVKRFKELELKLRQSQGGNNSKVVTLERQLDEQKRQNKELSKRISQLMEEGKKAA
jgi:hypothetical protein